MNTDLGIEGLSSLARRLAKDLEFLQLPARNWVPPRRHHGEAVRDVVIVGGGMCGLAAAARLKLLGVHNTLVLDRAPQGREGPWVTYARMRTLRSPKQLAGPALGLPALTFRAFFEAQFGRAAWEALDKIDRTMWMDYLVWYRKVLDLPVENETRVATIETDPDDPALFAVTVESAGTRRTIHARHVVLATGRAGLGGKAVPEVFRALPKDLWSHSEDAIDFSALKGKAVGVVGAGASAVDNAAVALEEGAASVDLFIRRGDIPRVNKFTGIGSPGVVHGFASLPDDEKWRFLNYVITEQTPPPRDSVLRVSAFPNARFHLASPVREVSVDGGRVRLTTSRGTYNLDHLILGTGFNVDLGERPELAAFAPHIRFWGDRFEPPKGQENGELAASPDLGPGFTFQEKQPGACPALKRLHCFNYAATLSHGKLSGDVPAVSEGADRLARAIVADLFAADRDRHFADLQAYDTPEILGDEWQDAGSLGSA